MATMAENKTRFLSLLNEAGQTRKGVDRLASWLETTDFFTAPASTRFYGAYEGGLLEHSLNVYNTFVHLFGGENDPKDSVILCTLFHDLCKCGMYTVEMRNRKNDAGVWEKVPVYSTPKSSFPPKRNCLHDTHKERWISYDYQCQSANRHSHILFQLVFQSAARGICVGTQSDEPKAVEPYSPAPPDVVDGIVFWTKNPTPMLDKLDRLAFYMYYFQFSITAYDQDVECHVPDKEKVIIPAFQRLSEQIGPDRVIWRYDPIFLNDKYTPEYHLQRFEQFAKLLTPYTHQCIFSFVNSYSKTERNMAGTSVWPFSPEEQDKMAQSLAEINRSYSLSLATCAEVIDLEKYGIQHAHCIDGALLLVLNSAIIIRRYPHITNFNHTLSFYCIVRMYHKADF